MAKGRKGAPGSFGAPLDELLPRLGDRPGDLKLSVDVHRRPESDPEQRTSDRCRIFMLNQKLYEGARK